MSHSEEAMYELGPGVTSLHCLVSLFLACPTPWGGVSACVACLSLPCSLLSDFCPPKLISGVALMVPF